MDFVVLDTEGKPELSELAIVDSQGRLIFEGFSSDYPNHNTNLPNLKSLKTLLSEFLALVQGKKIICHYAKHDIEILQSSFRRVGLVCPKLEFECTWDRAKSVWPGLESHSLEYLSKHLNLQVNNRYFIKDMAHAARYDAQFTYQLYRQLIMEQLKQQPNPFSGSRVDTPFQTHPDYFGTYRQEYLTLESILTDIKLDSNRQSKGVVVIGEPGTGKTHLMMRLANERLVNNRLLFIRQPNHPKAILHHIYSRILESLVQSVGSATQLDYLIINSFSKILSFRVTSQKDQEIIKALKDKNLDALGAEGTARRREYWQHIEKRISEWWTSHYSSGGFALAILKGIVKYCSYTDPRRKDIATRWLAANILSAEEAELVGLPNWSEDLSQEAFSLEAISVLAKLSILDEPLIVVFDQLEGLGLPHNREILLNFGEAIKEIFTHVPNSLIILNMFPDRWEQFQATFDNSIIGRISQYQIHLRQPDETELKAILQVKLQALAIPLELLFSEEDLEDILGQKPIRAVLNRAADYYNYRVRQIPLASVKENLHKLDTKEQLQQQLRIVEQQQQKLTEAFLYLVQAIQEPGSVDLANLYQQFLPEPPKLQLRTSDNIIEYLTRKKAELEQQYTNLPIISDYDDMGKLKTIAEAFNHIKPLRLTQYRLGKRVLPEHIVIETGNKNYVMGFLQLDPSTTSFTSRIANFNELVSLHPHDRFGLFRDERLTEVKGKVGRERITQLNNSLNGKFKPFAKDDRIALDLTYQTIIDIQNRDLDVDLESVLKVFITYKEWHHWLFSMFDLGKSFAKAA